MLNHPSWVSLQISNCIFSLISLCRSKQRTLSSSSSPWGTTCLRLLIVSLASTKLTTPPRVWESTPRPSCLKRTKHSSTKVIDWTSKISAELKLSLLFHFPFTPHVNILYLFYLSFTMKCCCSYISIWTNKCFPEESFEAWLCSYKLFYALCRKLSQIWW